MRTGPSRSLAQARQAFSALELTVSRRLPGVLHGGHEGTRLGPGSEPDEVVAYRPGEDDVRRIDWNVTARSTQPHVWRTRAEHELETWVLVDETASMDFGTVEVEKGELAAQVTGAVALLTDGPGNRLGVAHLGSHGLTWSPAVPSRRAAFRAVAGSPPSRGGAQDVSAHPAPPGLGEAMVTLDRRHRRPGLRVVVSDFVDPAGATERPFTWEAPLRRLAARHDVVVVEVLDPRELSLPDVGTVVLLDPETGRRTEVWTGNARLRRDYARLAADHRRAVTDAVRASGARHVTLATDRDWVEDLARFLRRPNARGRRRAVPGRGASGRTGASR
ncbi:MAG: hypothetical protein JWR42_2274 [Marmoricola sp.]|nr:hypothetical protein [Marmoricola sp.]